MKKMKKQIALILAMTMAFSVTGCGSGSTDTTSAPAVSTEAATETKKEQNQETGTTTAAVASPSEAVPAGSRIGSYDVSSLDDVKLTIASSGSSSNAVYGVQVAAADAIHEATDGKLTIDCVWDGTLGSDSELIENCIAGSIPMISLSSSPLVPYIPEVGVFECPAVYSDSASAYAGIEQFEADFGPIMEAAGLKLLALGFLQFRGLSSNVEVKTPEDFSQIKIRVMENPYHIAFWTNLGAQPTPLAFSELYTSLQQGLVNSQDNPFTTLFSSKFIEVQDCWMPLTAFPFVSFRLMNLEQFNALDPEMQQAVVDFAHEDLEQEYWVQIEDDQRMYDQVAADGSLTVLEQTDEIYQATIDAAKPVWNQIADEIGADIVDAYLATAGKTRS